MINLTDKKYRFNVEKAKKGLEWQPRFQLKQYMKVIIKDLKDDPKRWFEINKT
jgi:nucleoside-diphosphate-sugar epimerase